MTQRSRRDVLRDWWYSPERHDAITSMRFAKSIERTLAEAGYVIVPRVPTDAMVAAMKPMTDGPPTRRWQWIWNELIEATRGHGELQNTTEAKR
jgi:hypothetical protein